MRPVPSLNGRDPFVPGTRFPEQAPLLALNKDKDVAGPGSAFFPAQPDGQSLKVINPAEKVAWTGGAVPPC